MVVQKKNSEAPSPEPKVGAVETGLDERFQWRAATDFDEEGFKNKSIGVRAVEECELPGGGPGVGLGDKFGGVDEHQFFNLCVPRVQRVGAGEPEDTGDGEP